MDTHALRRIGWVTVSLGLTTALVGCSEMTADGTAQDSVEQGTALSLVNGLSNVNGLSPTNGLSNR